MGVLSGGLVQRARLDAGGRRAAEPVQHEPFEAPYIVLAATEQLPVEQLGQLHRVARLASDVGQTHIRDVQRLAGAATVCGRVGLKSLGLRLGSFHGLVVRVRFHACHPGFSHLLVQLNRLHGDHRQQAEYDERACQDDRRSCGMPAEPAPAALPPADGASRDGLASQVTFQVVGQCRNVWVAGGRILF